MADNAVDLWPADIGKDKINTPVGILRKQASLLGNRTNNLLEAEVVTGRERELNQISHSFVIVAPALDEYRYKLFSISQGALPYPVVAHVPMPGEELTTRRELKTEDEFVLWLKKILSSENTKRIINSLMAQIDS